MTKAKHKVSITSSNPGWEKFFHHNLHSIRSKVLQKLVLVWMNAWSEHTELRDRIMKRLTDQHCIAQNKTNIAFELKPKEVMELIGCSERTAKEYCDALRQLQM